MDRFYSKTKTFRGVDLKTTRTTSHKPILLKYVLYRAFELISRLYLPKFYPDVSQSF